jgi:hypothetical protein
VLPELAVETVVVSVELEVVPLDALDPEVPVSVVLAEDALVDEPDVDDALVPVETVTDALPEVLVLE